MIVGSEWLQAQVVSPMSSPYWSMPGISGEVPSKSASWEKLFLKPRPHGQRRDAAEGGVIWQIRWHYLCAGLSIASPRRSPPLDSVKLEAQIPVDADDNSATSLHKMVIGRQVESIIVEKFG